MRVEQINELADFHVSGRPDFEITGIAYAAGAGETEIAIAENVSELRKTKAQVVLMRPQFVKTEKTLIFAVESLEKAAVMIAEYFVQKDECIDYSQNVDYLFNGKYYYAEDLKTVSYTHLTLPTTY